MCAKILTGPLAARISGTVGNLTFENTRFGQVVQSKPVPPYPSSAAQQASITNFRDAISLWNTLRPVTRYYYQQWALLRGHAHNSAWIRACINMWNGKEWDFDAYQLSIPSFIITSVEQVGDKYYPKTTLDMSPALYKATGVVMKDRAWDPASNQAPIVLSTAFPGYFTITCPKPFYLIMFPEELYLPLRDLKSHAVEIT